MNMMNDELITLYFNYLITDFGFHVQKRLFDYSAMGNAMVEFRSSSIGIEIAVDRNAVSIRIGDQSDGKQGWAEFAFVLKHFAPALEPVYVIPEKTSDNTWEDVVRNQLDRLARILRDHCELLLKGDLFAMAKIKILEREEIAKMKAEWSKATSRNNKNG